MPQVRHGRRSARKSGMASRGGGTIRDNERCWKCPLDGTNSCSAGGGLRRCNFFQFFDANNQNYHERCIAHCKFEWRITLRITASNRKKGKKLSVNFEFGPYVRPVDLTLAAGPIALSRFSLPHKTCLLVKTFRYFGHPTSPRVTRPLSEFVLYHLTA